MSQLKVGVPQPEMDVPTVQAPVELYHPDEAKKVMKRWIALLKEWRTRYSGYPDFVARSPGRVNIIGEHIDYSMFPVLPMAIHADTLVAVRFSKPAKESGRCSKEKGRFTVKIGNYDMEKFPTETFTEPWDSDIPIDASTHSWVNYFKAGLRGGIEFFRQQKGLGEPWLGLRDMEVLVYGTVPPAGGLSSSAALVTASALAVLYTHGYTQVHKLRLTQLAIDSERAVGVNSGGMDQAASVLSEMGSALYVEFLPHLTGTHIQFPDNGPRFVFMVAQSFVTADKKVSGPFHYNLRVVECTLAALVLLRVLYREKFPEEPFPDPLPRDKSPLEISLGTVFNHFWDRARELKPKDVPQGRVVPATDRFRYFIDEVLPTVFTQETYSKAEIAEILQVDVDYLDTNFIKKRFPVPAEKFRLRDRARHVFKEALRVHEFRGHLVNGPAPGVTPLEFNEQLGDLLNQSQISCRDDFDCSCQEIDLICKIARDAGSYGSRLTGAGWGGATVHLVAEDKVFDVRRDLREKYYADLWVAGAKLTEQQIDQAVVVSRPGSGSAVLPLDPRYDYIEHWEQMAKVME